MFNLLTISFILNAYLINDENPHADNIIIINTMNIIAN